MLNGNRNLFVRVLAVSVVGAFLLVATVTTIISVGAYCITSNGADTSSLPDLRKTAG